MRTAKLLFPWIMMFSMVFLVPSSFAAEEYVLLDGSRAVLMEKQLVLIHRDGKRSIAGPGWYDTRDGRFTIVVGGKGIVVRDHTKELR
jgi:hypothetical protein